MLYKDTYILNGKSYKTNCVPVPGKPQGLSVRVIFFSLICSVPIFCDSLPPSLPQQQDGDAATHPRASQLLEAISSESVQGDAGNTSWEDDTLAEPEIPGLWKEDYKPYQVSASCVQDLRLEMRGACWPGAKAADGAPRPVTPLAQGPWYLCRSLLHISKPSCWPDLKF